MLLPSRLIKMTSPGHPGREAAAWEPRCSPTRCASGEALAPAAVRVWLGREGADLAEGSKCGSQILSSSGRDSVDGSEARGGYRCSIHRNKIINDLKKTKANPAHPNLISLSGMKGRISLCQIPDLNHFRQFAQIDEPQRGSFLEGHMLPAKTQV